MENLCYFVSSYGFIKSCNYHSPNPKSSCNNDYKYLENMIRNGEMFDGMSIYVCSNLLPFFINIILPKIQNTFTLVSGDSDLTIPVDILSEAVFLKFVNNPLLIKWFCQNKIDQVNHPKMVELPIGLDYHTISKNPSHKWKKSNEDSMPLSQESLLINIRKQMKPFQERIPKIYINFSTCNDRFLQRQNALNQIPANLMVNSQTFTIRTDLWKNITNYAFVLSPFGMGMDCHRTWEILLLGAIPIICGPQFTKIFEDMPPNIFFTGF